MFGFIIAQLIISESPEIKTDATIATELLSSPLPPQTQPNHSQPSSSPPSDVVRIPQLHPADLLLDHIPKKFNWVQTCCLGKPLNFLMKPV
ncbi:unnamed protein product [Pleuronectes platessa]|uniref:Uncharacterized protein n=1 Tax=Pleuronectes platessa TaxID=8262 RepID=A0A9N7YXR7_PLEPL|nr:unnamed protein product [Pleuronectes platessa]